MARTGDIAVFSSRDKAEVWRCDILCAVAYGGHSYIWCGVFAKYLAAFYGDCCPVCGSGFCYIQSKRTKRDKYSDNIFASQHDSWLWSACI